jgi:hypothetical protein
MPAESRGIDRLDDNLAQCVVHAASFHSCQALALTCRRLCKLVGESGVFIIIITSTTITNYSTISSSSFARTMCMLGASSI